MDNKLNIIFFGEDTFSNIILISLIEAGHNIKGVVTPCYENNVYKKLLVTCQKYGIKFIRSLKINGEEVKSFLLSEKPDLCVIAHFERLIKSDLLQIPRMGFINLHPSLLPNYRGMAPQHWPIINGEKISGITIHKVDEGTDTGDIILQEIIEVLPDDYVSDLQKKWMQSYKTIMVRAIQKLVEDDFKGIKQSHLAGSYYGKLSEEECQINKLGSIKEAYRLIRGVSMPYYGARWNDYILWRAHFPSLQELEVIEIKDNDGLYIQDDKVWLQLNKEILLIDKYQKI